MGYNYSVMTQRRKRKQFFLLLGGVLLLSVALLYLWPVRPEPFELLYSNVHPRQKQALLRFRTAHPTQTLVVNGNKWSYLITGSSHSVVLFLHGMTGAPDIWFQQIGALTPRYRCISVTYPPVDSLNEMAAGVLAILNHERIQQCAVVGSSLGGYLTQYLVQHYPERFSVAVLVNTFPPNQEIERENRTRAGVLPLLPSWLVMRLVRQNVLETVLPAANNDPLTRAFLLEMTYGRMTKAHFLARYQCIIEPFEAKPSHVPVMILESDNDPLVKKELRQRLKELYPRAQIHSFPHAGHFPYLNEPKMFNQFLRAFLEKHLVTNDTSPRTDYNASERHHD